jgi:membrane-associated phospholipid phosphatase
MPRLAGFSWRFFVSKWTQSWVVLSRWASPQRLFAPARRGYLRRVLRGSVFSDRLARFSLSALAFSLLLAIAPEALAQEGPHRLNWQSNWRRVNGVEYAATTGIFATFVAVSFLPPLENAVWSRPIALDDATRRGLRATTPEGRRGASQISDVFALVSYLPPILVDPLLVAGIDDENPDVAWQLFVISTQSYGLTITLNAISKRVFARSRPYAEPCARDPGYSDACKSADRFRSFYSGHSAVSATSAGLICAHHTHLPLYGGGNYDRFTCLGALAGMVVTGTLRMVADKHWHSDVVVGHLLGLSVGYLLPTLVYYRGFQSKPDPDAGAAAAAPLRSTPLFNTAFTF